MSANIHAVSPGVWAITVACRNDVDRGDVVYVSCGADVEVTKTGEDYTVPEHCDSCEQDFGPTMLGYLIEDAATAWDNRDGTPDGEAWSGGFARNH